MQTEPGVFLFLKKLNRERLGIFWTICKLNISSKPAKKSFVWNLVTFSAVYFKKIRTASQKISWLYGCTYIIMYFVFTNIFRILMRDFFLLQKTPIITFNFSLLTYESTVLTKKRGILIGLLLESRLVDFAKLSISAKTRRL